MAGPGRPEKEAEEVEQFFRDVEVSLDIGAWDYLTLLKNMIPKLFFNPRLFSWANKGKELANPPAHVPMSYAVSRMVYDERAVQLPYENVVLLVPASTRLTEVGFVDFTVDHVDSLLKIEGCFPVCHWDMGTPNISDSSISNSIQFRGSSKAHIFVDVGCENKVAKAAAQRYIQGLRGTCEAGWKDGVLKANWQLAAFPENHITDFDKDRALFIETEANYRRLLEVKRRVDPEHLFTPNTMIIGASEKLVS